ncbi:HP0729 family protein [Aliarcobacter butzleri]|uniref:HP0729 family protein n=1 Tax=Aliarcobacter butzleri TaxID=28197 RepID=UPI001EDAA25C|nr:HP0729 family protein [Aliarcobacter butzleri]MCG3688795.1 ATP-binding protein [Aliarcobacter butzleri]
MQNLLILYNPYYQEDVIEQHLKVLIENQKVAFGKVKSKLKNTEHNFQDELEIIYKNVDESNHLQLFLTDYSSIYVAKVVAVSNDDLYDFAPAYYKEKNLEVETWYVISDICEIVKNDFEKTRNEILANFTTTNFGNHTYAVYGNSYVYPLVVDMKNKVDYFNYDEEFKYYFDIFKSAKYLAIKQNIIDFSFGSKYIFAMHPNSLNNIISSEIELQEHKLDKTYDFSSIAIKYSKTMEQEIYLFIKTLFKILIEKSNDIKHIQYTVQGINYNMPEILEYKPNLGTYKFLLKLSLVENVIKENFEDIVYFFIRKKFINYINFLQDIRNEVVHGKPATLKEVNILRENILGIASESILIDILKYKQKLVVIEK